MIVRLALALSFLLAVACGASDETPAATSSEPATGADEEPAEPEEPEAEEPGAEEPEAAAEPEEPPPPEPVEIAETHLGPIRIGMTQEELDALGLEGEPVDPRSRMYGPYRVWVRDGSVREVEASIGDLERIRFGEETFEVGVDIYTLRDALPGCVWVEGGGERYVCADRQITVRTEHTMDPRRYVLGVQSR